MPTASTFVLVHSPLVGSMTWALVAAELARRRYPALVPTLPDARRLNPPYWQAHAEAVAQAARDLPADESIILVGHSGAGALLPAIRAALHRPVTAYVFVDAIIPQHNASRLDLFGIPEQVAAFRQAAVGGLLPVWSADDLRDAIPDSQIRERFAAELEPLPLAVYEEPIPVFAGWPEAACAYLLFNPASYAAHWERANHLGWACAKLPGSHFQLLNDAPAVTDALLKLVERCTQGRC
jgi:alpha-beta hydrolase superfamily lysophospholipase